MFLSAIDLRSTLTQGICFNSVVLLVLVVLILIRFVSTKNALQLLSKKLSRRLTKAQEREEMVVKRSKELAEKATTRHQVLFVRF